MDPDEALRCLRRKAAQLDGHIECTDSRFGEHVADFVEQFMALDAWLTSGGFKPAAWRGSDGSATALGDTHDQEHGHEASSTV